MTHLSPVLRTLLTFCSILWRYWQIQWAFIGSPDKTIKGSSLKVFISSVHPYYGEELLYYDPLLETTKASNIFQMRRNVLAKQTLAVLHSNGHTVRLDCTSFFLFVFGTDRNSLFST